MPEETLTAIETALKEADTATLLKSSHVVRLLRSLAYEPKEFERAISLLIKFSQADADDDNGAADVVPSLFQIALSGTHAPIAVRLKVLGDMLQSDDGTRRELGLKSLDAVLKTDHFSSSYAFEFGARSRDYGYYPPTGKDVRDWFGAVLQFIQPLALSSDPVGVCASLARKFRGLWSNSGQADALEALMRDIGKKGFWRDGWVAVRQTRIYDGERMPAEIRDRLTALEEFLRPKDLVDKVKGVVLGSGKSVDLDDLDEVKNGDYEGAMTRMNRTVEALGKDVASDDEAFKTLLPSLVKGGSRVPLFGEGIGSSTEKPYEVWQAFVTEFSLAEKPDTGVMGGFLTAVQKRDAALANKMLDEAVEQPSVGVYFPHLQARVIIDEKGVKRLHRALELGKADITQYYSLGYGRASDHVPGPEFRDLLLAIASKPDGLTVALEILSMRLVSNSANKQEPAPEVGETGRILLDAFEFQKKNSRTDNEDHELGRIARVSLADDVGIPVVRRLLRKMMAAVESYKIQAYDQDDFVEGLLRVHPKIVLDEMFAGDEKAREKAVKVFVDFQRFHKNPLGAVPDDVLLIWCDADPAIRYPLMAASASLFKRPANDKPHEWLPLVSELLKRAPDPHAVLKRIVQRVRPWSWSGSLATKLEERLKLLDQLPIDQTPQLAEALGKAKVSFEDWIAKERKSEAAESRARGGRFED